jgi:hypothetical protein
MSDALNLAEIDGQHAELLPPRTVLSVFSLYGGGSGGPGSSDSGDALSSCAEFAQPNEAVGPLGLGGATGWVFYSCTPTARVPS